MTYSHDTLILASGSPRRKSLLADMGERFVVIPPAVEEPTTPHRDESPAAYAESLAYFKARSVADQVPGRWVLGADTIVALDGEIMGKPADESDARRMLRALSHHRHAVITGMALIAPTQQRFIDSDTTYITMVPMGPREIDAYLATGEWDGKAGAYAIQETADQYVSAVEGSFSNVVGLPVERLGAMLEHVRSRI
jgi:septum formation protein